MKRIGFALLILQILLAACSKTEPTIATAVIHVTFGNSSGANIESVAAVFSSYDFSQHANQTLGLAKLWGISDTQVTEKINGLISVRQGNEPDLYVIEAHGLDHELAIKILNELCSYCSVHEFGLVNGGQSEEAHVSIVQVAK